MRSARSSTTSSSAGRGRSSTASCSGTSGTASSSTSEQIPRERYRQGDRIRAYIKDVTKTSRGPEILLSRADPRVILKLFEQEVPEVYEGVVSILSVAREPGFRTKIAVRSRDRDGDPVGACVGMKGSRVQSVVQELRGERIDIIAWHEDPARFVCNALQPAEIIRVLVNESGKSMEVVVPEEQLLLAIGKRGQNVKLASKLVGWHIEVRAEGQVEDALKRAEGLFAKKPEGVAAEVPPPEGMSPEAPPAEGGVSSEAPPPEGPEVGAKEDVDVDPKAGLPSEASSAEDAVVEAKEGEPTKE